MEMNPSQTIGRLDKVGGAAVSLSGEGQHLEPLLRRRVLSRETEVRVRLAIRDSRSSQNFPFPLLYCHPDLKGTRTQSQDTSLLKSICRAR